MRKKVVLLNSSFVTKRMDQIEETRPCLRVGIATIGGFLRRNNIDVVIVDPQAERLTVNRVVEKILSFNPSMVGLPAYTEEVDDAATIAGFIKKHDPSVITVVGGPHPSALPVETLQQYTSFDVCVYGEGELTSLDLASDENFEKINGIAYREKKEVRLNPPRRLIEQMDALPYPAWDLYQLNRYHGGLHVEPLRGCPFSCIFCFRTIGRKVRFKTPTRAADEIEYDIGKFGISSFRFVAGTFPLEKKHAYEICEEIINRRLKIRWSASTRIDTVDEELLKEMKLAGCTNLQFGVESGDPEILKRIAKQIKPEDAEQIFKFCRELGIKAGANFIVGLPYETEESFQKTVDLALKLRKYARDANFAILVPFPGTQIFEMASDNVGGLKLTSKNWRMYGKQAGFALEHENFPGNRLQLCQTKAYLSYYLRSNPLTWLRSFSLKRALAFIKRIFNSYKPTRSL